MIEIQRPDWDLCCYVYMRLLHFGFAVACPLYRCGCGRWLNLN